MSVDYTEDYLQKIVSINFGSPFWIAGSMGNGFGGAHDPFSPLNSLSMDFPGIAGGTPGFQFDQNNDFVGRSGPTLISSLTQKITTDAGAGLVGYVSDGFFLLRLGGLLASPLTVDFPWTSIPSLIGHVTGNMDAQVSLIDAKQVKVGMDILDFADGAHSISKFHLGSPASDASSGSFTFTVDTKARRVTGTGGVPLT